MRTWLVIVDMSSQFSLVNIALCSGKIVRTQ